MTAFIAGKRADFQCCLWAHWRNVEVDRLLRRRWRYARRGLRYQAAQPRPLANALRTTRSTFAQLSLKNDAGDRVMFGVAERDQCRSYASLCGKCFGRSRKSQKWFPAFFFANVDVAPAHCLANACAERFCHRFLSGETRSQMARREFHRHGIFNLTIRKHAVKKAISKSVNGTLNARALHKIDTDSNYAHFATRTERPGIVGQALRLAGLEVGNRSGCPTVLRQREILIRDTSPSRRAFLSRRFPVRPTSRAK
jgi:hypothetical protein